MISRINWWLVGIIAFSLLFLYLLSPILTPFFLAGLLAYLTDPLVNRLVAFKLPRPWAVTIVFIFIIIMILLMLFLIVPLLERQIVILIKQIPTALNWIQQVVLPWASTLGVPDVTNFADVKTLLQQHWAQASNVATFLLRTITHSSYTLFVFLLNLILVPVVTFYLLRDWDNVLNGIHRLLPRSIEPLTVNLVSQCDEVIGAFFRGQFLVMIALGLYYSVALSMMNLDLALLIGMIVALISIVPYLGFTVGILLAALAAFIQFQDGWHVFYVAIIFAIGHLLENYILYPKLVGGRIGLHPVAVIFSILAGGQLFGFLGVLLALPVAAVIMVMVRYMIDHYYKSDWYSRAKAS
ncbi:MAG: AI-2E family transporter [Gammaproteobacteria bacterium]